MRVGIQTTVLAQMCVFVAAVNVVQGGRGAEGCLCLLGLGLGRMGGFGWMFRAGRNVGGSRDGRRSVYKEGLLPYLSTYHVTTSIRKAFPPSQH